MWGIPFLYGGFEGGEGGWGVWPLKDVFVRHLKLHFDEKMDVMHFKNIGRRLESSYWLPQKTLQYDIVEIRQRAWWAGPNHC